MIMLDVPVVIFTTNNIQLYSICWTKLKAERRMAKHTQYRKNVHQLPIVIGTYSEKSVRLSRTVSRSTYASTDDHGQ